MEHIFNIQITNLYFLNLTIQGCYAKLTHLEASCCHQKTRADQGISSRGRKHILALGLGAVRVIGLVQGKALVGEQGPLPAENKFKRSCDFFTNNHFTILVLIVDI